MVDLRATYRMSDEYARIATVALFGLVTSALIGSIFFSPAIVLFLVFGCMVIVATFFRPEWTLLFLLLFLPLEPFILKWIPDNIYLLSRFFSEILVYLLVAAAGWKILTGDRRFTSTPIDIPFLLFLLVLAATTIINFTEPLTALLGARQILRFMLLFFVTVYLAPSKEWIKTVLIGLFAVAALQMALGIGQFFLGEPLDQLLLPSESRSFGEITITEGTVQFWDFGQRVFGTLGRYDRLGTFLAFFLLIAVAFLYEKRLGKDAKRYLSLFLLLGLPVLALTYSRSAWFGFVLGFLFIGLYIYRDKRVAIAGAVAAVTIALYLSVTGLVVNQLIDVSDQNITERFFEAFSYERWRGEYYGLGRLFWMVQTVVHVVPASPIFGHGPAAYGGGAVAALGNTRVYDELGIPFGVYGTEGYIDNNWFSLWGEVGTVGLGMYLWIYLALFLMCLRVYRRSKDPFTRHLALGVAAAMLAVALNAFLATFLEVRTLASYLWVFTGLVFVLAQRERINLES